MSGASKLVISEIAQSTPVGETLEQSAAAIRAGVSGLRSYEGYYPISDSNEEAEPLNAGHISSVLGDGAARLINLIERPFATLIQRSGLNRIDLQASDLLMALPILHDATRNLSLKSTLSEQLPSVLGLPKFRHVTGIEQGESGTIHQIARACKAIIDQEIEMALIVSVDSYLINDRLIEYDRAWRIKSKRCPTGFSPAESASVLLIEKAAHAIQQGRSPKLIIERTGFSKEINSLNGVKSSTGEGLGQALLAAYGNSSQKINWLFSDLNGENYPSFEWGLVNVRHNELFGDSLQHVHTADVTGHLGAATSGVQLGFVSEAFRKDYAIDKIAMLYATNEDGRRVALKVTRPETSG